MLNSDSYLLKYPVDTNRYYDAKNVLSPALRTHITEGLRGFNKDDWSVKMLSGKEI